MRIGLTFNDKESMGNYLHNDGIAVKGDMLEEYDEATTIQAITETLQGLGHEVLHFGWGWRLHGRLHAMRNDMPNLFFNIAEGYGGRAREAQVPAMLEMLQLPYVGSDAMALALSLDKGVSRELFREAGLSVATGFVSNPGQDPVFLRKRRGMAYPLVVKPCAEGSSRGISSSSLVYEDDHLIQEVDRIHRTYAQAALVEQFVYGREVTVGLVGDPLRVWGVMEIVPKAQTTEFIYSLDVKRNWRTAVRYELMTSGTATIERAALAAARALGCRDMARVDMRLSPQGLPVILEINPLPGLNPESSDLCLLTEAKGATYQELFSAILEGAIARGTLQSCLRSAKPQPSDPNGPRSGSAP